jgi:hypothetical protein
MLGMIISVIDGLHVRTTEENTTWKRSLETHD